MADLYFFSPTCGPCKRTTPLVDKAIEAGRPIEKIDVSTEHGRYVAALFGVTATPALVKFMTFETFIGSQVLKEFQ